jgi:hypothetical protein
MLLYMRKIQPQSKRSVHLKIFRATLNRVFSFLRLVILRGKQLRILIPAEDAPY